MLLLLLVAVLVAAPAAARHPGGHVSWHVGWGWGGYWGPYWGPYWGGYWGPGWYPGPYAWPVAVAGVLGEVAVVDTDVSPEHARVLLNGTMIGIADDFDGYPDYLYLKRGRYTLEFQLQGYTAQTLELDVSPGQMFPIDLKLARNPAEAKAAWYDRPKNPPASRVFGPAPQEAAPGAAPYADPSLRPELRGEGAPGAQARPPLGDAALDVVVSPGGAAVYLDGEFLGTGAELRRLQRGVAVSAGRHRIEVVAPGLAGKTVEFEVSAGETRQIVIELEGGLDKSVSRT
jgi:hypothetical protein